MLIAGNMSTGMRDRLTAPRMAMMRQATTMRYGLLMANLDMDCPPLWRGIDDLHFDLVAGIQPRPTPGNHQISHLQARHNLHPLCVFDSQLHRCDSDRARFVHGVNPSGRSRAVDCA